MPMSPLAQLLAASIVKVLEEKRLRSLAAVVRRCPTCRVEIERHCVVCEWERLWQDEGGEG
jgi:hypothetical protein